MKLHIGGAGHAGKWYVPAGKRKAGQFLSVLCTGNRVVSRIFSRSALFFSLLKI